MTEVITIVDVMYAGGVLFPKGTILKVVDILPDGFALVSYKKSGLLLIQRRDGRFEETGLFSNEYEIYNPSLENK